MRITKIEDLHCNAGWRDFSFLKISTDEGVTGWSEFMESYGSEGLAGVIRKLGSRVIGWDPRAVEKITAYLHGVTRQSVGGIAHEAIGLGAFSCSTRHMRQLPAIDRRSW